MPTYKLTYFDSKARVEVPRYLFAKAGVPYQDVRLTDEQFKSIKDKTPFGQLPFLEVDGHVISQSLAIARFLGKRFGFYGKNEFEEVRIDEIALGIDDMLIPLSKILQEQDEAKKVEPRKKYAEETLPSFFKFLERLLVENNGGNGFFVGNSLTAADLFFYHYFTYPALAGITIDWGKFPKLQALRKKVEDDPKIAEWLKKRPVTKT